MKKPINNFAVVLRLLALLYAALMVPEFIELFRQPARVASPGSADYIKSFASRDVLINLRSTIFGAGSLAAFGMVVERLDRIRWDARRRKDGD